MRLATQVESYVLGYIRSYSTLLMLVAQIYLVGRLARVTTESTLAAASLAAIAAACFIEALPINLLVYLGVALPLRLIAHGLLSTALQTLFTRRVPAHEIGAALGSMGVLQSASGVLAPLYGAALFRGVGMQHRATAAGVHYLAFAVAWVLGEAWAQRGARAEPGGGVGGVGVVVAANGGGGGGAVSSEGRLKVE
jgi:hypothetical protein